MDFFVGLLTVVLVLNCMFLMLVILIQLPKKEAGLGTAFGSATTDALFGAGTGNALTNITRYAATLFFVLSLSLSIINANRSQQKASGVMEELKKQSAVPASTVMPAAVTSDNANTSLAAPATTNLLVTPGTTSTTSGTNVASPGTAITNPPPANPPSQSGG